jgi:hypothetical protein
VCASGYIMVGLISMNPKGRGREMGGGRVIYMKGIGVWSLKVGGVGN